mmetsp:Transcript_14411/g.61810  ORF Transcript_14411/g.61810 Transcript_14411/m.61810 type:complete len:272 (+) Transcript_14411:1660-2475(+)
MREKRRYALSGLSPKRTAGQTNRTREESRRFRSEAPVRPPPPWSSPKPPPRRRRGTPAGRRPRPTRDFAISKKQSRKTSRPVRLSRSLRSRRPSPPKNRRPPRVSPRRPPRRPPRRRRRSPPPTARQPPSSPSSKGLKTEKISLISWKPRSPSRRRAGANSRNDRMTERRDPTLRSLIRKRHPSKLPSKSRAARRRASRRRRATKTPPRVERGLFSLRPELVAKEKRSRSNRGRRRLNLNSFGLEMRFRPRHHFRPRRPSARRRARPRRRR